MKLNSWHERIVIVYAAIAVAFVVYVFLNQRGYQDSWILQDVFVQTILYVLTFSVIVVLIDNNKLIAIISASFLVVLNAIPNLKYELFYSTYDAAGHYGYISNLVSLGHVPSTGFYASTYQDFPGMHIFIGSISTILGLSPNVAIKLVTSMIMGIFPLMTYFATNRVFKPSIQRFIIVASGLPTFMSYMLSGTTFALALFFCIVCLILRSLLTREKKRPYIIVLLILVFGLLFSHAMTTLYLTSFLIGTVLLLKLLSIRKNWILKSYRNARVQVMGVLIILVVSFAARLTFESGRVLELFINQGEALMFREKPGVLPTTLFRVPFSAQAVFFVLAYIMTTVIALMSCVGIIVLFMKFKRENKDVYDKFYPFLLCFVGTILALIALQFLSAYAGPGYDRLINYAIVLSPFLVGLFLWHVGHHVGRYKFGSAVVALILFFCIFVSLFQIFPFQPIAPRANVLSPDLPADEYVFDFRSVNTVYQEKEIFFAMRYSSSGMVASDIATKWQIRGFANDTFSNRLLFDSPLMVQNLGWDLFLLHYDGKAGPLNEKVENRTSKTVTDLKCALGNNVVYDNGESFILSR